MKGHGWGTAYQTGNSRCEGRRWYIPWVAGSSPSAGPILQRQSPGPPSPLSISYTPMGSPWVSLSPSTAPAFPFLSPSGTWELCNLQTLPPPGTPSFWLARCPPGVPTAGGAGDRGQQRSHREHRAGCHRLRARHEGSLKVEQGRGGPGPGRGSPHSAPPSCRQGSPDPGQAQLALWVPRALQGSPFTDENSRVEIEGNQDRIQTQSWWGGRLPTPQPPDRPFGR